jgi:hypothetical protein
MIRIGTENLEQGDPLGLPWDIGEWVDKHELIAWIDAELEGIDWTNPTIVTFEQKHPQFRPKMFLRLLTYAYATSIYASEDVAEACYRDELFRQICEGDPPTARAIRAFRRENRSLLQWFLMEVFKQSIKHKFNAGDFLVSPGLKRSLADAAIARIDLARHMDRGAREE